MAWIDDVLAVLQRDGAPSAYAPQSVFPAYKPPVEPDVLGDIQRQSVEDMRPAFEGPPKQILTVGDMPARVPFGFVPQVNGDLTQAARMLEMNNAPAGTGVPGIVGEAPYTDAERAMMATVGREPAGRPPGAPDGSIFGSPAPFGPGVTIPPSLAAAKEMAAPPPPQGAPAGVPPAPDGAMANPGALGEAFNAAGGAFRSGARPSTDVSSQARPAGAPPAPPAPQPGQPMPPAPPAEPSVMDTLRGFAPALIGAGGALQGDGGAATMTLLKRREEQALLQQQQNLTASALLARGAPQAEVQAAVKNPDLMKALIGKYFETKPAQNVGGVLVRERPDGKVDVVYDNSTEKAPTQREVKLPGGLVQQQEYVNGKWANVGVPAGPEPKAPTQRELALPNGSVQQQEFVGGKWVDVGPPAPKDKDRRLSVSDVTKLSEEGGKLQQIQGFRQGFRPEFGGWKSNKIGDLANEAARNLPESVVGKTAAAAAAWWQDYDRYKNMVRHELFGSALTKGESDAFMRADIGPGMTPEQIARNLATQQRVVESAIRRKGKGLIGSTYDKAAIASAYGVPPEFFDQADESGQSGTITIGGVSVPWSLKK